MIDSVDTLTSKIHAYMYGHFEISIFSPQMEIFMKFIYSRKSCYSIKFRILSKNMRWYIPYPWQLSTCKMLLSIKLMLFHNWKIVRALWARTSMKNLVLGCTLFLSCYFIWSTCSLRKLQARSLFWNSWQESQSCASILKCALPRRHVR